MLLASVRYMIRYSIYLQSKITKSSGTNYFYSSQQKKTTTKNKNKTTTTRNQMHLSDYQIYLIIVIFFVVHQIKFNDI
jgi:uncharacterized ion transporter superfamily protein YfcC